MTTKSSSKRPTRTTPFLPKATVAEIERLKEADPDYWRVYGLGERGKPCNHPHALEGRCTSAERMEANDLGLDFGYTNDPRPSGRNTDGHACPMRFAMLTGLTNAAIAQTLREADIGKTMVVADSAEPKSIDETHGHGFNIHPARKGQGLGALGV